MRDNRRILLRIFFIIISFFMSKIATANTCGWAIESGREGSNIKKVKSRTVKFLGDNVKLTEVFLQKKGNAKVTDLFGDGKDSIFIGSDGRGPTKGHVYGIIPVGDKYVRFDGKLLGMFNSEFNGEGFLGQRKFNRNF